jgi:hypothetical protein
VFKPFLRMSFLQLYQRIRNQILRFYSDIVEADETAQKTENFPNKCVLEFNFATIKGLGEPSC